MFSWDDILRMIDNAVAPPMDRATAAGLINDLLGELQFRMNKIHDELDGPWTRRE